MNGHLSIVGVGRLGVCAALAFEAAGYSVLGCDINAAYVARLNDKSFQSPEPGVTESLKKAKNFRATTDLRETLEFSSLIFIFVDTPTGGTGNMYDCSKLSSVLQLIANAKVENKHVIISCTVSPGYVRDIGRYLLRECATLTLSYNPEFIAQGAIMNGFVNPDMVLIGEGSKAAGDAIETVYKAVCRNSPRICRMSPASAEITKLALNCFVTMKIAYCNAIGDVADATPDADARAILAAVGADSRIGSKCMMPGYGFGGPCFPRDSRAFAAYATSLGLAPHLQLATDAANDAHRQRQVEQLLAQHDAQHVFVFESVTYKDRCPVPIIEHSQKLLVAAAVARAGRRVVLRDRADVLDAVRREYGGLFNYEEIEF